MKEKLSKKDVGFAQIKNEVLSDKNLSWKAKGIFAYLYSKPDDWDFSMHRIKDDSTDGKESVRMGLKELEDAGYLIRTRQINGRMNYHLTYQPCSDYRNKPCSEIRNIRKSEQPIIGTVSNKDINTNKEFNTNKELFDNFWNAYDKKVGLKEKVEKKWNKLSLEDQKAILEYIPKYKIAQPNKTYRKNPETFLNNRSWEDELISDNKGGNKGMWKCEYGHMHKRGEECGHALERRYQQSSSFAQDLKSKMSMR